MNAVRVKKSVIATAAIFSVSIAHAGDMGSKPHPVSVPYAGAEVSASWISKNAPNVNGVTANLSAQNWGGRLSAGMLRFQTEKLGLMAELGGGYYGSRSTNLSQLSSNSKLEIDGYDALIGVLYKLQYLDVFGQIGFMGQNARVSISRQNLNQLIQGDFVYGSSRVRSSSTEILPELRAGGIYNFRDDLGMTLTYMHAFGSTPGYSGTKTGTRANGLNLVSSASLQNPSLNSILLGLRYYVV